MRTLLAVGLLVASLVSVGLAGGGDESKKDARLGPPRHYDLKYFPWNPPKTLKEWEAQRERVRERVLVSQGLWPLPEKTPLNPVIHGKIERDGYTIEKVFFASYPGHYVSGNLYRPTGKTGRLPAILSPHGHWANGRFYEASDKEVDAQMKSGGEKTKEGAKYPLQARCAQLARLGCVVFHYDMVGVADSKEIPHRQGFLDVEAELRLQNFMGLQTWNSIRALDFLISLPDVDAGRIGVTGASGGGTQTFMLCAVDDRPAAAFPAVMVSTAMQGGCICENASYLRIEGNNIQLAAMMAPRPLGMAAANDWTKDIMTKGLPELKQVYQLHADKGFGDNVMAEAYLQFGHNYNQVSRELMYNFFNKHLGLGHKEPITEQPFVPVPPKELSVYDAKHPLPKDATNGEGLRRYLTEASDKQMKEIMPKGKASLTAFRQVIQPALKTMITDSLPAASEVELRSFDSFENDGRKLLMGKLSRKGRKESILTELRVPSKWDGRVVLWIHPDGLVGAEGKLFDKLLAKTAVCAVEVFRTGASGHEATYPVNKTFAGYTFGYNRPVLADRVHDILTAVAWVKGQKGVTSIELIGFGKAGPWVALARGLCGDAVARTAVDANGFRFESVKDFNDEMMLPGAVKYGGLLTLAAVSAPHELLIHNTRGCGPASYLEAAYEAAGASKNLVRREEAMEPAAAVDWLLR
jgi:dienelactone hydrolase